MSQLVKTKRQAIFKDFKQFGAFKGLVEQKKKFNVTEKNFSLFLSLQFFSLDDSISFGIFKITTFLLLTECSTIRRKK
jgi:hypothetical protein